MVSTLILALTGPTLLLTEAPLPVQPLLMPLLAGVCSWRKGHARWLLSAREPLSADQEGVSA